DADVLVNQGRSVVAYFLDVAERTSDSKAAANWVTQDVLRTLKEQDTTIERFPVAATALADLIQRIKAGEVPSSRAREVFQAMVERSLDVSAAMSAVGISAVDESELIALCKRLLDANPRTIADVRSGKTQAIGALIGKAKKINPNVDPTRVREICLELIGSRSE
ncbi:MAG TPA: Asp-tRNA(Asn)/Glu-tRNA(Gln) amidotransferase GatCAB subunit B, partial [Lacipirellulaceae bacterium]